MAHRKVVIFAVLSIVISWLSAPVLAAETQSNSFTPVYMELTHDSDFFALVGEQVINAGELKRGQQIQVLPTLADYYEFTFGNGVGLVGKDNLKAISNKTKVSDSLGDLNKPPTNQNLITQRPVVVYSAADKQSEPLATLRDNLRYPIRAKLKDHLNTTWYEINLGDRLGYISDMDSEIDNGIPILTYHHLLKNSENKYFLHTSTTTSDVAFSNQMTYLKQAGYDTISLYQLEDYIDNKINLPGKVVVLTFDDGLKSVYRYAYPVLEHYQFRATAFIISSRIKRHPQKWNPDSLQFLSISELKKMQDVFDIQSHTHFLHRVDAERRPILLSRSFHNIEFDLEHSERALAPFNPHVRYLSYPFGGYNQRAINAAQSAGLKMAVTTVEGKVKPGDDKFRLKRLYILRTDSIPTMAARIANQPATVVKPNP